MEIFIPFLIFAGLGLLLGALLYMASVFFKVKVDPKVEALIEILPGANCGGCGYAGCNGLAVAIVKGEAPTNACTAGGKATAEKAAAVMGTAFEGFVVNKAFVKCGGCNSVASKKYTYTGAHDCISAAKIGGGDKSCYYGCLGLSSCVKECRFGAITIVDGIAKVDHDKCTGCGRCAVICPKKVIDMIPDTSSYMVACASVDKAATVRAVCGVGCIACRLCVKKCAVGAITVENNLAHIDQEKCTACGECAAVCPRKIITFEHKAINVRQYEPTGV